MSDGNTCPYCGAEQLMDSVITRNCQGTVTRHTWECGTTLDEDRDKHEQSYRCRIAALTATLARIEAALGDEGLVGPAIDAAVSELTYDSNPFPGTEGEIAVRNYRAALLAALEGTP